MTSSADAIGALKNVAADDIGEVEGDRDEQQDRSQDLNAGHETFDQTRESAWPAVASGDDRRSGSTARDD